MCETCGCGDTKLVPVDVHESLLESNNARARHNREHFEEYGVTAINLMGSPGAGKTALLERTAQAYGRTRRIGAISGDLATELDAVRMRSAGIPALTISTGSACHLDAEMIHEALHEIQWTHLDYLFIENVGNLVCPAVYDLGQRLNVVALSVVEGEDKPLKYPVMFQHADVVLITKIDLLPHLPHISVPAIESSLEQVMPNPVVFQVSALTGEGIGDWLTWLESLRGPALESHAMATHGSEVGSAHRHEA